MANRLILRSYEMEHGERPSDLIAVMIDAALDSDSEADIDLRGIVRKGAPVWYRAFNKSTTNGTTGVLAINDDVGVASGTHTVMIVFAAGDMAQAGE